MLCWLGGRKGIRPVKKLEWWGAGMIICLERGADLHMAHLMPLPLTVSCFSKIQIGFTFLVLAHPRSPRKRAVKRVCVCVCACVRACVCAHACVHVLLLLHPFTSLFSRTTWVSRVPEGKTSSLALNEAKDDGGSGW